MHPQLAFSLEMEPGNSWLCVDVSSSTNLDLSAAHLIDERLELWCEVCRAGGLSEMTAPQNFIRGQAAKYIPAIGADFVSTEIIYGSVAVGAPAALINLLDELARTGVPIDRVSIG
jgi:hypothetical protein